MTIPMILTLLGQGLLYGLKLVALIGLGSAKWLMWLLWPAWLVAAVLGTALAFFTGPAKAGWLDGFWGPDPKIEAANHALQQAAQIATEAARTQSSQQNQLLAAIEALSSERTQIAGQLGRLGEMATRDSAWAAALQAFGPVLIVVAVLAIGCAAIWMVTRSSDHDSYLAAAFVTDLCNRQPDTLGLSEGDDPSRHPRIDIYSTKDIYSPLRPETTSGLPPTTPEHEEGEPPF